MDATPNMVPVETTDRELARSELVSTARAYAAAAKSPRTAEVYRRAWGAFVACGEAEGVCVLPAAPAAVALYLAAGAAAGRKPATLALDLAAISEAHRAAGHASPRGAAEVRAVLRGIRRTHGVAQRQVSPLLPADLRRLVAALPDSLVGKRDRALLLLGFATASRRSELVGLDLADLRFVPEGLEVRVARSKTDQEGAGMTKAVPLAADPGLCPVRAVRAWVEAAGIADGPVFRSVNRHGQVAPGRLTGHAVAAIVKRSAEAAGLDPAALSGHSLRAGLATAAALAGKSLESIARATGHRSIAMVRRYVRAAELWRDCPTAGLL